MLTYSQKSLLSFCLIIFFAHFIKAQGIDLKPKPEKLQVDGQKLEGHSLIFDFTQKEIFKAWWKYSRVFSRNETKKEDIKHTIPPKEGESTVPIVFYSRVESPDSLSAKIIAALSDNGMTSDNIKKYSQQVKELLVDFKVSHYKNNLQRKISDTEKLAGKIGKSLDRYTSEKIKLEQRLVDTKQEKVAHKKAIFENDSLIHDLSQRISTNTVKKDSVSQELENIQRKLEELRQMIGRIR